MTNRERFAAAIATTFHPHMEGQSVDYLVDQFTRALEACDWAVMEARGGFPMEVDLSKETKCPTTAATSSTQRPSWPSE